MTPMYPFLAREEPKMTWVWVVGLVALLFGGDAGLMTRPSFRLQVVDNDTVIFQVADEETRITFRRQPPPPGSHFADHQTWVGAGKGG